MRREETVWRRLAVYLPGLIAAALLQAVPRSSALIPVPDLLFLFPMMAGLWTTGYDGFAVGLAAGFLRDYMAGRGYGVGMLIGMFTGLLAGLAAREGWRQYAIRGGMLIAAVTLFYEILMSLFAWLWPLNGVRSSLGLYIRLTLSRYPSRLLSNLFGALLLTGFFVLAFKHRKKRRWNRENSVDVRGGESLAE
ncbi:MAG TPA: hypothetical protein PKH23_06500 [Bacillota bacterium]|nr:hypothetical protein [Bacillota bacterium]